MSFSPRIKLLLLDLSHHIIHSIAYPRLIVIPWSILFPQGQLPVGIVCPTVVTAETTEEFRALIEMTQPEVVFSVFFLLSFKF